ncbi:MAG: AIR synthase-related protein, partial [Polynucleobacter victoriensis]
QGFITGASNRNWASYGADIELSTDLTPVDQAILTDPQTSGGLLVACDPAALDKVLEIFAEEGFGDARVIGQLSPQAEGHSFLRVI